MSGDLVGTEVRANTVFLWYQSPTGDSSDVQIGQIVCGDMRQAVEVESEHRARWDLPALDRSDQLDVHWEELHKV